MDGQPENIMPSPIPIGAGGGSIKSQLLLSDFCHCVKVFNGDNFLNALSLTTLIDTLFVEKLSELFQSTFSLYVVQRVNVRVADIQLKDTYCQALDMQAVCVEYTAIL